MEAQQSRPTANQEITASQIQSWPSVPTTPLRSSLDTDQISLMDVDSSTGGDDRTRRATSVLSMDDIEAAQALEGLRSDYIQSPSRQAAPLSSKTVSPGPSPQLDQTQPEPLLSLLTQAHPYLGTAINGSMFAYTSSKSYSPRFRYGAEFVERNIGSPVASTVGAVGRKTGVEGGIRWALQRRESAESASQGPNTKRRKVSDEEKDTMDVEKGYQDPMVTHQIQRRASNLSFAESLPAYDDQRSPQYEEIGTLMQGKQQHQGDAQSSQNPRWQTRLMISTSGLGVAMSEESLRSLKYCLSWLRWANGRLDYVIVALKNALKEWDEAQNPSTLPETESDSTMHDTKATNSKAQHQAAITERIQALKSEVLSTLKRVVDVVSTYAGGALPENARNLVRRHLTSLPQRFRIASSSTVPHGSGEEPASETVTSAHRVMVLAQEGLDMMGQVSGVVNDTLVSAESWCEKLGRRRRDTSSTDVGSGEGKDGTLFLQQDRDRKDAGLFVQQQDVNMMGMDEKS